MARFRGTYPYSIDVKGRLSVPTRFRDVIREEKDSELVITWGRNNQCLSVYALSDWEKIEEQIDDTEDPDLREDLIHKYVTPSVQVPVDKSGRILIPAEFREAQDLTKEVMVLGALNKFEIWNKERWEAEQAASQSRVTDAINKKKVTVKL